METSRKLIADGYEFAALLLEENTMLGHSVKLTALEDENMFEVLVVFAEGVDRVFVGGDGDPYEVIV